MDEVAYKQFRDLEQDHWWFQGRRSIFFSLLDQYLDPKDGGNNGKPHNAAHDAPTSPPEHGPDAPKILDIGCGMGGMLPNLSRYGHAFGFDVSRESLEHCKARGFPHVAIGDGYRLPFSDDIVDLVTLFDTVEHIDDDRAVMREAFRITKPGGLIMVTVPAYQFLFSDNDVVAHHKRRYTAGDLKKKLREAGYDPLRTSYYNVTMFPVIVPVVLLKKLKMKMFGVPKNPRSNISYAMPKLANSILSKTFCAERHPMKKVSYPVGHSLLCLAKKPA